MTTETENKPTEAYITEIPINNKMVRIFTTSIEIDKLASVIEMIQADWANAAAFNKYFSMCGLDGVFFANAKNVSLRQFKSMFL